MKTLFAIVVLAAAFLSSEAAPSHAVQFYKNDVKMLVLTEAGNGKLHDIWSICSKRIVAWGEEYNTTGCIS
jgi:hypothetical protein